MTINTTRFGVIEVDDKALISMPEGMIGLEKFRSYCLIDHQQESIFKWLQSTDEPDLAFLVIDPSDVVAHYEIDLPDWDVEFLGLKNASEAVVVTTVTISTDANSVAANLLAPIVINSRTRVGRQVVLDNGVYTIRHEICALKNSCAGLSPTLSKAA